MNAQLTRLADLAIARIYIPRATSAGESIIYNRSSVSATLFDVQYHFSSPTTVNLSAPSFLDPFNLAIVMFKIPSSLTQRKRITSRNSLFSAIFLGSER
jgi:hypothetical protein